MDFVFALCVCLPYILILPIGITIVLHYLSKQREKDFDRQCMHDDAVISAALLQARQEIKTALEKHDKDRHLPLL